MLKEEASSRLLGLKPVSQAPHGHGHQTCVEAGTGTAGGEKPDGPACAGCWPPVTCVSLRAQEAAALIGFSCCVWGGRLSSPVLTQSVPAALVNILSLFHLLLPRDQSLLSPLLGEQRCTPCGPTKLDGRPVCPLPACSRFFSLN